MRPYQSCSSKLNTCWKCTI